MLYLALVHRPLFTAGGDNCNGGIFCLPLEYTQVQDRLPVPLVPYFGEYGHRVLGGVRFAGCRPLRGVDGVWGQHGAPSCRGMFVLNARLNRSTPVEENV